MIINIRKFLFSILFLIEAIFFTSVIHAQKVQTSYLWHMDQPVYWADRSRDKSDSKQFAEESHRLKTTGFNIYPGSTKAHPTNDLEEIFSKADRVHAYQTAPRNAINSIRDLPFAGAQLSISAGLMENIQSLGVKNQWGYTASWMNSYKEAIGWKTNGGFPRLDVVGFTYDHALSPLVSERTLVKQIQAHQYAANKYYGFVSKGYWPAECAFSERIIKALVECNIEWSVVANSHLARTLADYNHPYNINGNIDAPNRADRVSVNGINWFDATIDGRGSRLAAPYCYQVHKAQYIDPENGNTYKIDVVPMCNYLSYVDGYSGANTGDIASKIEPFSTQTQPSIVLLAHDGDNAWGGGSSYYNEAVTSFTHSAANAGYKPTTIQQFLNDNPVPANDIVRVEDGAWVNAENDWGHPQFINWLWPLYDRTTYRFNPDGWTEDARNWAVITATENFVTMAEDLEGGNLRIKYIADGGSAATDAEKAWHFYFGGLNSGFMYYGKAEDMEVKPSLTGNIAIDYAQKVIKANSGTDRTPPSVFIPQRFPYNPGSTGFGPTTGYKKINYSTDFHVWTFAYDVNGLSSVKLKYRTDFDGVNPIQSIQNETFIGGNEVTNWTEIDMTRRPMSDDPTNDPELNFFIEPFAKAELCYAEIKALKDTLIDYYVEAIDTKGNIFRTPIQHVYIENGDGSNGGNTNPNVSWNPEKPKSNEFITIKSKDATSSSRLHWGVNGWQRPIDAYLPANTVKTTGQAVETPFQLIENEWQVKLGPFNNPEQTISNIDFVIKHENSWDNNGGSDYLINITPAITDNPLANNFNKTVNQHETVNFTLADFGFYSPIGNGFKALKIINLPGSGSLTYNNEPALSNQIITEPERLIYISDLTNETFTFRVIDTEDNESDAVYTVSITVKDPESQPISVWFKKPEDWGTNAVYIWAWNTAGNLFSGWPGIAMTEAGNGWYKYTFDEAVKTINVVFSKNGNPQTVDITGIEQTSCYQANGLSGNKISVTKTECFTSVQTTEINLIINVFPQPADSYLSVKIPDNIFDGNLNIQLSDLRGITVLNKAFTDNPLIIERKNYPSGMYILSVMDRNKNVLAKLKVAFK